MDEQAEESGPPPDFNEAAYLTAFPKIAENIRAGLLKSGYDHYVRKGASENRLDQPRYRKALAEQALLARLAAPVAPSATAQRSERMPAGAPPHLPSGLDAMIVAPSGYSLVIGWVDDRATRLSAISLRLADGRQVPSLNIARCRRADAEAATGCPPGHLLGFFAIVELGEDDMPGPGTAVQLHCGTDTLTHTPRINLMAPEKLRDHVFEYFASAHYFGSQPVEAFLQLQGGIGEAFVQLNQELSARIAGRAHVERHGPHDRRFRASIIVCLYGKIEYLFLQAALFSAAADAADYEYVYVSNSPELTEQLQREARLAARLYGLSFTMIYLPGNAGFGAANNVAVQHASCDRVLILNPDVFPRDTGWTRRHAEILETRPAEQTRLFGAPLFYDDGSLMQGGMYFEADIGLSLNDGAFTRQELLRVEHYGKGAPPGTKLYLQSRAVPAVTGAFMSAERAWFERIGGFSEAYVFGHYEDADLCLKAWQAGGQVWVHNLPLWHLEGKGSVRRAAHEGGSLVNRWLFTRTWLPAVHVDFLGPNPGRIVV
jgi:GT2 family glycosyltransferase